MSPRDIFHRQHQAAIERHRTPPPSFSEAEQANGDEILEPPQRVHDPARPAALAKRRQPPRLPPRIQTEFEQDGAENGGEITQDGEDGGDAGRAKTPTLEEFRQALAGVNGTDSGAEEVIAMFAQVTMRREQLEADAANFANALMDERSFAGRHLSNDLEKQWAPRDSIDVGEDYEAFYNRRKKGSSGNILGVPPNTAVDSIPGADGARAVGVEIMVKHRLLPAVMLLRGEPPDQLTEEKLDKASEHARRAYDFAQRNSASEALQARCAFYVGLAEYLKTPYSASSAGPSPATVSTKSSSSPKEFQQSRVWFDRALAAKGVFDEGDWAQEWLNSQLSGSFLRGEEAKEPGSAVSTGSWSWFWRWRLWGRSRDEGGGSAVGREQEQDDEVVGKAKPRPREREMRKEDVADRGIPSFESGSTGLLSDVHSRRGPLRVVNPDASVSSSSAPPTHPAPAPTSAPETEPALQQPIISPGIPYPISSPSPITPNYNNDLDDLPALPISDQDLATSPKKSLFERRHRRGSSLFALLKLRERQPCDLEKAEEGQSPYRAEFGEGEGCM